MRAGDYDTVNAGWESEERRRLRPQGRAFEQEWKRLVKATRDLLASRKTHSDQDCKRRPHGQGGSDSIASVPDFMSRAIKSTRRTWWEATSKEFLESLEAAFSSELTKADRQILPAGVSPLAAHNGKRVSELASARMGGEAPRPRLEDHREGPTTRCKSGTRV